MADLEELINSWFNKANSDLKVAKTILKHTPDLTDSICFHSQQAVEKYLKAFLLKLNIKIERTHDLSYLCKLIRKKVNVPKEYFEICSQLTQYAITVRYPLEIEEPSLKEAKNSVTSAQKIIKWIKKEIQENNKTLFSK